MLYLIRHAEAVYNADDDVRELSARGREEVLRLAAFLRGSGEMKADEIRHSPLLRARQTAELLAGHLGMSALLRESAELKPEDDPAALLPDLRTSRSLALVGHEPHLGSLASLLVAGSVEPQVVMMGKCAILALERVRGGDAGCWAVRWQVAPELLVQK